MSLILQADIDDELPSGSVLVPTGRIAPITAAVLTWIIGAYVALLLVSPYWYDDLNNKNIAALLKATHQSLGGFLWTQISGYATKDARFFPGAFVWTYSLFEVFDLRTSYKLALGLLLALALVVVALCAAMLAKSWAAAGAFVLIASTTLQVRLWADGITAFAGIMALTTALTLGALLLLLAKPGRWWTVLAGALYLAALLTYEAVFVLAPIMILVVIMQRRHWRPAIAIALPAIIALLTTISLRLFTHPHPLPEYTISLSPGAVLSTLAKQVAAALPLSQWWLGRHIIGLPPIAGTLILLCAVLIGFPAFLGFRRLAEDVGRPNRRGAALLALVGVWMWIAPAALIAVTKRWQTSMPWGEGYISVVYEYFGLALCVLSLWLSVGGWFRSNYGWTAVRAWNLGSAATLALLASLTMAANLSLMP